MEAPADFHHLTNHDTRIRTRDYCHVNTIKNGCSSFGAVGLNFVAVREFITKAFLNCSVYSNYIERILCCVKRELSVQIAYR